MKDIDCRKGPSGFKKVAFGLMLLAAGLTLFGFNFGYFPQEHFHIVFSFPTLLIAIGVMNIFDRKSLFFGLILTIIGVMTLLPKIMDIHYDFSMLFWPLVLIGIGILVLTKKFFHRPLRSCKHKSRNSSKANIDIDDVNTFCGFDYKVYEPGSGYIDEVNIFSGNEYRFIEPVFRGGTITNIFGGNEIDFTRTQLAEGKNVLDVTCVFGGTNIIVPSDWKVTIQVNAILGAFEDKRYFIDYDIEKQFDRELIITGSVIFGGGELKSR